MGLGGLGAALGLAGRREEALVIVGDLQRRGPQGQVNAFWLALVSAGLGEHDEAIALLEQAADQRQGMLVLLNMYPVFDPLRSDPRFQALLKKMNFPARA